MCHLCSMHRNGCNIAILFLKFNAHVSNIWLLLDSCPFFAEKMAYFTTKKGPLNENGGQIKKFNLNFLTNNKQI